MLWSSYQNPLPRKTAQKKTRLHYFLMNMKLKVFIAPYADIGNVSGSDKYNGGYHGVMNGQTFI